MCVKMNVQHCVTVIYPGHSYVYIFIAFYTSNLGTRPFLAVLQLHIWEYPTICTIYYTVGVKVRNMKIDFNTGGTWCCVGQ